jgi:DNA-binding CsgD family transcriptional regulator
MLLGRGAEQARIDALLAQARDGTSGTLLIRGEPGIGKTALLHDVASRAGDMTVLRASGVESESDLAFAGLAELLHPILGLLDEIPESQARALQGVLAIGPPVASDRFTISVATLSLLAAAAEQQPVLGIVDDAHWLDAPSRDAIFFAARRLQADRTVMLFATRVGEASSLEAPGFHEVTLEGLDRAACQALLTGAGPVQVAPAVARKILEATGGNPLAVLEAPRVLSPAQLSGTAPLDEPLPIGPEIQRSFARRVGRLPARARQALLLAAASRSGSVDEVRRAGDLLPIEPDALDIAMREGLVESDGTTIRFVHPLVRAAAYHGAATPDRRRAHRALATALAGEQPSAHRAWHLAAAADGPDGEVADAIEVVAREAHERSGPASAASAFERAARLTPDPEVRALRLLEAGTDAHAGGDPGQARALLSEALSLAEAPTLRADIEHALGRVEMWAGSTVQARSILLAAADRIEPLDPARAALLLMDAASTCLHHGDPERGMLRQVLPIATRAHALGSVAGGSARAAASGVLGAALILLGEAEEGYDLVVEGLRAVDEAPLPMPAAQMMEVGAVFLWLEEHERALQSFQRVLVSARASPAPTALVRALIHLAEGELRIGRWASAHANAAEGVQLADDLRLLAAPTRGFGLIVLGWVEAGMGREEDCRQHCAAALATSTPPGTTIEAYVHTVLGHLALGLGRCDEAVEQLERAHRLFEREGVVEPLVLRHTPDLIEAYLHAGARDRAVAALESYGALPRQVRRTWARATAARCHGMLAEAAFDEHFLEALRLHDLTPTPFERARTELCYGERLRRARRRADAGVRLRSALETFERLGADPWAERAVTELRLAGLEVGRRERFGSRALTAQELQVALRVATGATNREAAAALFLSTKTIESHLGRIYAKLGVRSRTELAHRLTT